MLKGTGILSLLLFAASTNATPNTQLIKSEAANVTAIAGRIGEAALYAVQADDDADLEIFATASSDIDKQNDYWLLLDWNDSDPDNEPGPSYKVIKSGSLQSNGDYFLTSYQISHTELLLGQQNGGLTSITFTDIDDQEDPNDPALTISVPHSIGVERTYLSAMHPRLDTEKTIDTDIKAIISIEGTDHENYTVICSESLIHILDNTTEGPSLTSTLEQGGYCQTGNIDYVELGKEPNLYYDQELITQEGLYFTYSGTEWVEKTNLSTNTFGESFLVANIDDDDADEILAHSQTDQLQSFSPSSNGSWVFLSALQKATGNFGVIDIDNDGIAEIFFDHIDLLAPYITNLNKVSWDVDSHSHTTFSETIPHTRINKIKRLATTVNENIESDFYLFTTNADAPRPNTKLLARLNENDLSTDENEIELFNTKSRSFEVLAKTTVGDSILNYNIVQLDQMELDEENFDFAYKFLAVSDFSASEPLQPNFKNPIEPDFNDFDITSIRTLVASDFNGDNLDDLHAGGKAGYINSQGIVFSHYLNGITTPLITDTPTIESITALYAGNINLGTTPDIIATGKNIDTDEGIGIHMIYDGIEKPALLYTPSSGDTDFTSITASNIKGEEDFEILGLHSNLTSFNANYDEPSVYQLNNLDLANFTPVTLNEHEFELALASDIAGMLYLIEPKDFDILYSVQACESELVDITSIHITNGLTVALALCEQQILSWVVEYRNNYLEDGYGLHALTSYELGFIDTSDAQLIPLQTTEKEEITIIEDEVEKKVEIDVVKSHLIALFKDSFKRFELDRSLGANDDAEGADAGNDDATNEDDENYPYYNYQDAFPLEATQWADTDLDGKGDNQDPTAFNPDPSLNDFDNDGVEDDVDPDNIPENDFDATNDEDHGLPHFKNAGLSTIKAEYAGPITTLSLLTPSAEDVYDDYPDSANLIAIATLNGTPLTTNDYGVHFEANLTPGRHAIIWQAQDQSGNIGTETQEVWVYPTVAFEVLEQNVGETQLNQIKVVLNGPYPDTESPATVSINVTGGNITNDEVTQDITESLDVIFTEGQTEAFVQLDFIDDQEIEANETIELTIADNFASTQQNPNLIVDTENNITTITVVDLNGAPDVEQKLFIEQKGELLTTTTPNNIDGVITLSVDANDPNDVDALSYSWNLTTLGIENPILLPTASIDPTLFEPGEYIIEVTVMDDGLPSLTTLRSFLLSVVYGDSDSDGVLDNKDVFPNDKNETKDNDGDGVGDNADPFDENILEWADSDGDGVGNNADLFDDNASEWADADGDGHGDNIDVFDDNADEWQDTDNDGFGDKGDAFPENPNEHLDSDGDGIGDKADVFPGDAREFEDSDGDGVGNNADDFDNDPTKTSMDEERNIEDSAGALYLYLFLFLPLLFRRRK